MVKCRINADFAEKKHRVAEKIILALQFSAGTSAFSAVNFE